ncbi:hypothetical protein GEMRC1_012768 [Eukaryota sp. GEM-RC1]
MRLVYLFLFLLSVAFASHDYMYTVNVAHDKEMDIYNPKEDNRHSIIFSFKEAPTDVEVVYQLVFLPCARVLKAHSAVITERKDGTTLVEKSSSTSEVFEVEIALLCDHKYLSLVDSKRSRVCIHGKTVDIPEVVVHPIPIKCVHYQDHDMLAAIFFAARGELWHNKDYWLSDHDVCKWYGVDCEDKTEIRHLFLADNNLWGVLHPAVGCLSGIRTIGVEDNSLFGFLPKSIELLEESLQHLRVSKNHLRSPLPNLCRLKNLQFLYLDNNLFKELPLCKVSDWKFLKEIHAQCTRIPFPAGEFMKLFQTLAIDHELFEIRWFCSDESIVKCPDWYKTLLAKNHLLADPRCGFVDCECKKHPMPLPTPKCPHTAPPSKEHECEKCIRYCTKKCMFEESNKCYRKRIRCFKNCYFEKCEEICAKVDDCPPERPLRVFFDIRPGVCPNRLSCKNLWLGGVVSASILGTKKFDVEDIDTSSLKLWIRDGPHVPGKFDDILYSEDFTFCTTPWKVYPVTSSVASPYYHPQDELYASAADQCSDEEADEFEDLTFNFLRSKICKCIKTNSLIVFKITGQLHDGTEFEGIDILDF